MRTTASFWDKVAERYAKKPIKNVEAYEHTLERTRSYLSKDDKVLEVGCGTGSTALLLAESVRHLTASDISGKMIAIADAKKAAQEAETLDFVRAELFDEALNRGPYDAVLAFSFLHLLEDTPAAVRRIRELLKPGGLFISKTLCLGERRRFWAPLIYLMRQVGQAPYVKMLTIQELDTLLETEGFEILETGLYPASPPARFVVARKI